jgi:hypothetical protein
MSVAAVHLKLLRAGNQGESAPENGFRDLDSEM